MAVEWTIVSFRGKRMERLALERRELDTAMSWLSTLGGAFSALGEEFQHCVSTYCCSSYLLTYSMAQQPLKSFDRSLMRISLPNSVLVTLKVISPSSHEPTR